MNERVVFIDIHNCFPLWTIQKKQCELFVENLRGESSVKSKLNLIYTHFSNETKKR
jgi:hypothetical protein